MNRKTFKLAKTSLVKINKFFKKLELDNLDYFKDEFNNLVYNDCKFIKECSEKYIVEYYISTAFELLDKSEEINDEFFDTLKQKTRIKLANKYASNKFFDNNIDVYFNDVKREYIKHPMNESDSLEFLPENKDIFISNNLKLVIECAKRFQNLGLDFEDLIQAGNYGLLIAFDKFDTERANLRFAIINEINNSDNEEFSSIDAIEIIKKHFTYSKNLDSTIANVPEDGFINKQDFIDWVKVHVKTAVFASVAFQWIRAYILLELNKNGKVIKLPKSEKDNNVKISIINLDAKNPRTEDTFHDNQISDVAYEEFITEDENVENMEHEFNVKAVINSLLSKLNGLDRRILKKKFGIDVPYPLSISEISESENITPNKVKYSITSSLKLLTNSLTEEQKENILEILK